MGKSIESGEEIINLLNDYFLSVFTRENLDAIPTGEEVFQAENIQKLRDVIVTWQVVQKEIKKLKKNTSPGPEEIHSRVRKECKQYLSGPLANMFWESVNSSHVPKLWK